MSEYGAETVELCTDLANSCCPVGVELMAKKAPKGDPNRERAVLKGPELLKALNIQLSDAPSEERMLLLQKEAAARKAAREEEARLAATKGDNGGVHGP